MARLLEVCVSIKCTEKQKLFIEHYIKSNGNGTKSALSAFSCKNNKSASSLAHALLKRSIIWAEMAHIAQEKGDDVVVEFALERLRDLDKSTSTRSVDCYIRMILNRIKEANMAKCDKCGKELELLLCDECVEEKVKESARNKETQDSK